MFETTKWLLILAEYCAIHTTVCCHQEWSSGSSGWCRWCTVEERCQSHKRTCLSGGLHTRQGRPANHFNIKSVEATFMDSSSVETYASLVLLQFHLPGCTTHWKQEMLCTLCSVSIGTQSCALRSTRYRTHLIYCQQCWGFKLKFEG